MIEDITATFEQAAANASVWTYKGVREAITSVVNDHPGSHVDWEPGDEEWARILDSKDDEIIAFICAKLPVGFIRGAGPTAGSPTGFLWISVGSTDEAVLRVQPEVLDRIFGRSVSRKPNYDRISADEVWWATV